jgi:hypothetical protein
MTPDKFRSLALSLPEAVEASHMNHPDFRIKGKMFASLGSPDQDWATVKLTAAEQVDLIRGEPKVFRPATGAWGRWGWTMVCLRNAKALTIRHALLAAWRNTAPKRLVQQHDGDA